MQRKQDNGLLMKTVTGDLQKGIVYLVGAGAGDGGLLTVKGMHCLHKAEVVVYDHLSDTCLLAHALQTAEKIYVGKEASKHTLEQNEINDLLIKKALEKKVVVRLKGGDPFVFGRGGEECDALAHAGIPYEVVPGITAGIAAPAYAGIPVTHRGMASSVAFITGNEDPLKSETAIKWEHLAKGVDTLVIYMGIGNIQAIAEELIHHGRAAATPAAVIRWGTKPDQQTVTGTLKTIAGIVKKAGITPPAIIIVGQVVTLRDRLQWFETRPLFGRRIINTRTREQASALSQRLADAGAEVVELPTIEIVAAEKDGLLDRELANIDKYKWVIFTSQNGVDAFFKLLLSDNRDVRTLSGIKIASIGPGTTAAIKKYFVNVDCTAEEAIAEGLITSLGPFSPWKDVTVLLPRAEKARDILPDTLRSWGAEVTVVPAYKTTRPENTDRTVIEDILNGRYDCITFSSSSTFENFVSLFSPGEFSRISQSLKAASIGPITSQTIRRYGVTPVAEAREHTIPGLVAAIEEYLRK
jgi:uroporphyrinogen III methyltransferase/synthase